MPHSAFSRMFNPRGIAVVGASADDTRPGGQTIRALLAYGYRGGIYPVNPKYEKIGSLACYASVDAIPHACDVAVIALPAVQVPEVVTQCARKGMGFAVVVGGGFREAGPQGIALEKHLLETARSGGVRLIGPNCLGYVNIPHRVFAGFGSITRPPELKPGPVSAVMQSGGFGNSLVVQAARAGVGFQNLVASGNETDINAAEMIRAYVDDPETRVILAYLEGLSDGRAFMEVARHALAAGKPIVVLKGGNTRQGQRAAASHTGCMLAPHDLYRAAFRQCGVIEARDIGDAVDYLKCLVAGRLPKGRSVAIMGGSGGSGVNFCDAADEFGLKLGALQAGTLDVLRANLPDIATVENPIDFTAGFVTDANKARFLKAVEAVLADPGVQQLGLLAATASGRSYFNQASTVMAALKQSDKPAVVFSAMAGEEAKDAEQVLEAAGIPILPTPRRVAAAMSMLARYAEVLADRERILAGHKLSERAMPALPAGDATLDEHAAKGILSAFGFSVSRDVLLTGDPARMALPQAMRYPVAVKVMSPDIAHKTDIGGVRLNITGDAALREAAAEVSHNARKAKPGAALTGVLVSEMVADGLETIIGAVNDPLFGPVVAFGLGGVLAEALHDTAWRTAPFDVATAREMIDELRAASMFGEVRGRPARDVEALAAMLSHVSELAWQMRDRLSEMDINPVMVLAEGKGVVAADALLVLKQ